VVTVLDVSPAGGGAVTGPVLQRWIMGAARVTHEQSEAVYEITLRGAPPAGLVARCPAATLYATPVTTVLSRRGVDDKQIDGFIERLRSIGITPMEVRAGSVPGNVQPETYCEFRIEGRLGDSMVRYLQWAARLEPERTVIRLLTTRDGLQKLLEELAESHVRMDHLIRHRPTRISARAR
jgi:hypothetical protein